MHLRKSSIFCRSSAERLGPANATPAAPPGGAGISNVWAPLPLLPPLPLSASETAAKPTAVIPAASSERPSGPNRIVMPRFFFIATPSVGPGRAGLADHQASRG